MTSVRAAKSKGSSFEYDVQYSLKQKYPTIYLTKQLGFQQQQDVRDDDEKFVVECKRLKGISWNQAVKFLDKLISVAPKDYKSLLVFKSNNQPALVMSCIGNFPKIYTIQTFEIWFGIPFLKHESTRVKKNATD